MTSDQTNKTSSEYLQEFVFPSLRKALERHFSSIKNDNPEKPNSRRLTKGLDLLSQELWNLNEQSSNDLFLKPRVKQILDETPRPIFSKHMILSQNEATVRIQAAIRGFLVRVRPDVSEMRCFWKEMRAQRNVKKCHKKIY